jgi:hypothetical protein
MKRFRIALPEPVSMVRTRYTAGNIALLLAGLLVSVFDFSYTGLILASMHIPPNGPHRFGADLFALIAALAVVSALAGFRWPGIASTALWSLTFFWFVLAVALHILPVMLIPGALLGVVAAIASAVEHVSKKARPAS